MIKILKGLMFNRRNMKSYYPESCIQSLVFEFRGNRYSIDNAEKWDNPPYLGGYLNRDQVIGLNNYLTNCLEDKRCDECYDFKKPSYLKLDGNLTCIKCGAFYR